MSALVRPVVQLKSYLRHGDGWRGGLKLVEKQFKVTNNDVNFKKRTKIF